MKGVVSNAEVNQSLRVQGGTQKGRGLERSARASESAHPIRHIDQRNRHSSLAISRDRMDLLWPDRGMPPASNCIHSNGPKNGKGRSMWGVFKRMKEVKELARNT